VDACLLSHHAVSEAVSFGAPDDKYGEAVVAAVVLKPGVSGVYEDGRESSSGIATVLQEHCASHLAPFKVRCSGYLFVRLVV
jgi:acyl-coenzyme A synthetase/AMP-(fatty) acid ligase